MRIGNLLWVWFPFIFLVADDVEHLFMCLFVFHLYIYFGEIYSGPFPRLALGCLCFCC